MLIPREGDWVMTKSKKIGYVKDDLGAYLNLYFPDDTKWVARCRRYKRADVKMLDKSMGKLLTNTWKKDIDIVCDKSR